MITRLDDISQLLVSQRTLKWESSFFNSKNVNDELINNIELFQKQNSIKVTGLIDPFTYRLIYNLKSNPEATQEYNYSKEIIYNNKSISSWFSVANFKENLSLELMPEQFEDFSTKSLRLLNNILIIPDYCKNIETNYLLNKHLYHSCHFAIDEKGNIHQCLNLQHIAYNVYPYSPIDSNVVIQINHSTTLDLDFNKNQIESLGNLISLLKNKLQIKNIININHLTMN